ncbi:MAG: hypothetical protein HY461_00470 [Parcubacteria group bacterium]|nr:hypothetical protein [Parcubacteria group bacterium]
MKFWIPESALMADRDKVSSVYIWADSGETFLSIALVILRFAIERVEVPRDGSNLAINGTPNLVEDRELTLYTDETLSSNTPPSGAPKVTDALAAWCQRLSDRNVLCLDYWKGRRVKTYLVRPRDRNVLLLILSIWAERWGDGTGNTIQPYMIDSLREVLEAAAAEIAAKR